MTDYIDFDFPHPCDDRMKLRLCCSYTSVEAPADELPCENVKIYRIEQMEYLASPIRNCPSVLKTFPIDFWASEVIKAFLNEHYEHEVVLAAEEAIERRRHEPQDSP